MGPASILADRDQIVALLVKPVGLTRQTAVLLVASRGVIPHIDRDDGRSVQKLLERNCLLLSVADDLQFKPRFNLLPDLYHVVVNFVLNSLSCCVWLFYLRGWWWFSAKPDSA